MMSCSGKLAEETLVDPNTAIAIDFEEPEVMPTSLPETQPLFLSVAHFEYWKKYVKKTKKYDHTWMQAYAGQVRASSNRLNEEPSKEMDLEQPSALLHLLRLLFCRPAGPSINAGPPPNAPVSCLIHRYNEFVLLNQVI